jgi:nicotinamide-nucleotide amidase
MKTTVVAVGKEVLTGKTVNTNLKHIASKLKSIGIDVNRSFVIDDQAEEYKKILDFIDEDLILFTGGLGPTIDDITRETVLEYFEVETELDQTVLEDIKAYFSRMNRPMKDINNKQALMPKDGILIPNPLGTAPGLFFKAKGKTIVLLPGPPVEMIPMLDFVTNLLQKDLDITLYSKGFRLVGTGESYMESKMTSFYGQHKEVNIAPYASVGEIKYIFTSSNPLALEQAMDAFYKMFQPFIYGNLEDTLPSVVVSLLQENKAKISFAESCTGGLLANRITSVSGSSSVLDVSFVTYANQAKMDYLGVSEDTLLRQGAVSPECAKEMANGLFERTNADLCLSVTGIAGPTGGTKEKPVGLVYFGLYYKGETIIKKRVFNGNREMVRTRAMIYGLNLVRRVLKDEPIGD